MYEKLVKLRNIVKRSEKRLADAERRLKEDRDKLKEEEATQILSDVEALNMTPEQLASVLALVKSGQLGPLPFDTSDENSTDSTENSVDKENSKDKENSETTESKESTEEMSDEDLELMKLLEEEEGKTDETY
ncbi:protein of unknown function [Oribacterium sp. KHPX15]|uniref:DUF4315 family protein n=1 Tax=Oribacterium sp. KHPX15 TaxID=1855342 RepID=UPI00089CB30C|nr:DUF4315 family protein [Oribacterium sp. KHPX15]SEA18227.1 protein of unknown function [Oribacterium sp. KHPX15]